MPKVPSYERQISPAQMPAVRNTAAPPIEAFGGGEIAQQTYRALSGLAGQIEKIADNEKRKADETKSLAADSILSSVEADILHNEKTGALYQKGEKAFSTLQSASERWEKEVREVEKTLTSGDQRRAFRKMVASRWQSINSQISRHVGQERVSYANQVTEASLAGELTNAAASWKDPERVNEALKRRQMVLDKWIEDNGIRDQNLIDQKRLEVASKTHRAVIDQMVNAGDDLTAQGYFKGRANGELTADDLAHVTRALEESSSRGQSQRLSDALWKESKGDLGKALDKIRNDESLPPKVKDMTHDRLKQRAADEAAIVEQRQVVAYNQAADIAYKAKSMDAVPPSLLAQMSEEQRKKVLEIAGGDEPITKRETEHKLWDLAGRDPRQFMALNLWDYRMELDDKDYDKLQYQQTQMRLGSEKAMQKLDGIRTKNDIVNETLKEFGRNPNPKPKTTAAEEHGQFMRQVEIEVEKLQQRGKPATNAEIQDIVDSLLIRVIKEKNSFWFDKKEPAFKLPGGEYEIDLDDVPEPVKARLRQGLRDNGLEPSDANIAEALRRKQRGRRK